MLAYKKSLYFNRYPNNIPERERYIFTRNAAAVNDFDIGLAYMLLNIYRIPCMYKILSKNTGYIIVSGDSNILKARQYVFKKNFTENSAC